MKKENKPQKNETTTPQTPLHKLQADNNADIFVISGEITRPLSDKLIDEINSIKDKRANALVFLCTFGGDGDAAYIMAKTLKRHYSKLLLYISGFCKSAGTIIALGANKIYISEKGELGPLDVQMNREDELAKSTSGLDTSSAISKMGEEAYNLFETMFITLIASSGANITTKTAADIATQLTSALVTPITEQLDPLKICETDRSIRIASEYSKRLGAKKEVVEKLIYNYPTHSFVIDFEEAKDLFNDVELYSDLDEKASNQIKDIMTGLFSSESIRKPSSRGIAIHITLDQ
ncbi:MAG: SppA protein [Anaerolineae bacterium]|nr:SppA protein [Anaerolineae bacterium]